MSDHKYDPRLIADDLAFAEGPIYTSDDGVILVEIRTGKLTRVDVATGKKTVVGECGGGPNGAAVGPTGEVIVCNNGGFSWSKGKIAGLSEADYVGGSMQAVDLETGTVREMFTSSSTSFTPSGSVDIKGPNDLVVDSAGGIWVTDSGKRWDRSLDIGGVHYISPDGETMTEILFPLIQPNGVGISPDGDRLYVSETTPGRLWWWPIVGPGKVEQSGSGPAGGHLLHGFNGFQPLDSLAVDSDGNICVATLMSGVISVVSPSGKLIEQVGLPEHDPHVTNVCFGGPDLTTAFVTSAGRGKLYALTWPCPGLPLEFNI